ncbi:hypothetical protein SLEP1_g25079 [Rubroshorea leprosula]|uniref:Uncharacterized protein n=1 Tax=Rubroshorea leprosula TaxID=152421 RepID=A0AAV5JHT4_9ROSI|nr:hypothetical protein SLEP1_g25079 [Rubroshorea leprosula]
MRTPFLQQTHYPIPLLRCGPSQSTRVLALMLLLEVGWGSEWEIWAALGRIRVSEMGPWRNPQ